MTPRQLVRPVAAAALAAAWLLPSTRTPAATVRTVYFSAADASGEPVTDLAVADLTVKEGGRTQTIDALEFATAPMDIALIIEDGGTGAFQAPTAEFLNRLLGKAQFSVRLINTQAIKIQDYTGDLDLLRGVVGKIGQRGRVQPDGDQLLEAVNESALELQKRKAVRPIIVAFTVYGEAGKAVDPHNVLQVLKASGASLNVMYVTGAPTGQMIGDGTKQSGGRCDEVLTGARLVPAAARIADTLLRQYAVTYTLADGVKPSDRFALSTSRRGVSLLAPTRIPERQN